MPTPSFTLRELARQLGGEPEGDADTRVTSVANVRDARPGSIVRVDEARYLEAALATPAAALLLGPDAGPAPRPALRTPNPRLAFAMLLELFAPDERPAPGVHPTAVLAEEVELGEGCAVLAGAVLGRGARLGKNVVVHAQCVLGDGVEVGDDSVLFPHVTLYRGVRLGARVRVHAGAVLGADGFGYVWDDGHRKIPQIGGVIVGDGVEIGAHVCIDRGTTGATRIGSGTKIDNLVQIAHNVEIGERCILVSQAGIAGSTRVGDGAVIGGQAGIKDHAEIGAGAQIAGGAEVWGDVAPGQIVSGSPARPHRERIRQDAAARKLPAALRQLARLERRLAELERRLAEAEE